MRNVMGFAALVALILGLAVGGGAQQAYNKEDRPTNLQLVTFPDNDLRYGKDRRGFSSPSSGLTANAGTRSGQDHERENPHPVQARSSFTSPRSTISWLNEARMAGNLPWPQTQPVRECTPCTEYHSGGSYKLFYVAPSEASLSY